MAEWISYESADVPPAEVSIDVDFDDDAQFKTAHPYAAIVTVSGFSGDAEGQPNDSTADVLYDLERQVESALNASGGSLVCTVSEDSKFTLYGYVADTANADALASISLSSLQVGARSERDDTWENYGRYILRGEELEAARDAEQLGELEDIGAFLDEPVDVSFYLEFDNTQSLRDALPALRNAGYTVPQFEGVIDDGMTVVRNMLLTAENLAAVRANLQHVTAPYNGRYDGWSADEDELEETDEAVVS
jgi:hypothetical protein